MEQFEIYLYLFDFFFLSTQKTIARFTAWVGKIQTERQDTEIFSVVEKAK